MSEQHDFDTMQASLQRDIDRISVVLDLDMLATVGTSDHNTARKLICADIGGRSGAVETTICQQCELLQQSYGGRSYMTEQEAVQVVLDSGVMDYLQEWPYMFCDTVHNAPGIAGNPIDPKTHFVRLKFGMLDSGLPRKQVDYHYTNVMPAEFMDYLKRLIAEETEKGHVR
jgi:hypothetical protein